jgi:hypothetical protein
VSAPQNRSDWARLFRVACDLIRQVNSEALVIDRWTFGGGTALMLQIGHRESHDVDFFLQDPQMLAFLDPQKNDFTFEITPGGYDGDGSRFLKLAFEGIGEIDFIVCQPATAHPAIQREIEGESILLETAPEIIAKKIVYRGSSIRPRDIFDIAAASKQHAASVVSELRPYKTAVASALKTIEKLNPEFVNNAISQLEIREEFSAIAKTAIDRTKQILRSV